MDNNLQLYYTSCVDLLVSFVLQSSHMAGAIHAATLPPASSSPASSVTQQQQQQRAKRGVAGEGGAAEVEAAAGARHEEGQSGSGPSHAAGTHPGSGAGSPHHAPPASFTFNKQQQAVQPVVDEMQLVTNSRSRGAGQVMTHKQA